MYNRCILGTENLGALQNPTTTTANSALALVLLTEIPSLNRSSIKKRTFEKTLKGHRSLSSFLLQVFPPAPVRPAYSFYNRHQELASLLPRLDKPCPAYVEPMTGKRVLGREQERQQAAVSDL